MPCQLTRLFGIELPIIQAPMAGVQGSALAIAVSQAGALGSLPCAMLSLEALDTALTHIRTQTTKPINVNFFCHHEPEPQAAKQAAWLNKLAPYFSELGVNSDSQTVGAQRAPYTSTQAEVLAKFKPEVVSFHFGLPNEDLLLEIKSWGSKIISTATTVEEALWLEARGADAIIAQGLEAGGHRGHFLSDDLTEQLGTFSLLPQIIAAVDIPVIAAGGIVDAKTVRAAMAMGASAVQVGTAYLLCPECTTSDIHRAALQSEAAQHTALTNLFTGRPARGIMNRFMAELGPINNAAPDFPLASSAVAVLRSAAEQQGFGDFSPLWCGQNATGCQAIPAAELTRQLALGLMV
ncbi:MULTISPECIES: NAD(P)H-dependent flavin oxidoreductase [unclassified Shewanella]|uniref:NAD(P)H-dependent flavin oxidoreductase n=1 Tax=unclassified Shewanella TaxID=196818 RepID=UPI000DE9834E|nr:MULTISPECIES: nitronate monooxygenase [unclassified Shewanella]MCU7987693.1 nitronate monooxygenase [Shewanella sp. SW24]MCU8021048.1 nitronate monooxygenase [Shewanella sp. SM78]MCU8077112.1 nitronate monooxygenase [Shewanella sp. SM103]RBP82329.1 nitronate monooxygenase [Shewanella putrefaciens]